MEISASYNYSSELQNALALKHEVVLDFTSLKACLDPQREPDGDEVRTIEIHVCGACATILSFFSLTMRTLFTSNYRKVTLFPVWKS